MSDEQCGHVPARPDTDVTLCWKCGVEIIADPDTHLFRPITAGERIMRIETIRQMRDLWHDLPYSEFPRITWEYLQTMGAPSIHLAEGAFGRWIIVSGQDQRLAWSGSRWVPHMKGIPMGGVQVCSFDTRDEAAEYADKMFPEND